MPCKLGCPEKPCPFNHEGQVTRASCGACINFEVPKHIANHCQLWDRDRVLCLKPKSACPTCPEYVARAPGAPVSAVHDRSTVEGERAYQAEYRAAHPDAVAERAQRFKQRNPDYWKNYFAKHREAINARRRKKTEGTQ